LGAWDGLAVWDLSGFLIILNRGFWVSGMGGLRSVQNNYPSTPSSRPSSGESARAAAPRSPPWLRRPRGRRLYRPAALPAEVEARPAIVTKLMVTRSTGGFVDRAVRVRRRLCRALWRRRRAGLGFDFRNRVCLFVGAGEATLDGQDKVFFWRLRYPGGRGQRRSGWGRDPDRRHAVALVAGVWDATAGCGCSTRATA